MDPNTPITYDSLPPFNYFGSEDSRDWDVVFFVGAQHLVKPDLMKEMTMVLNRALWLARTGKAANLYMPGVVNSNLALVEDGVITKCYKGTADEMNNALYKTYNLHQQVHPCAVTRHVKRDVDLKVLRTFRVILSFLSRTQHRLEVKAALRGSLQDKYRVIDTIDFTDIGDLGKRNIEYVDFKKTLAFQLGQTLALMEYGVELYTKNEIGAAFRELAPMLHRLEDRTDSNMKTLARHVQRLLESTDARYTPGHRETMFEPKHD